MKHEHKQLQKPSQDPLLLQQHGLQTDCFEPTLSPRNPMQKRVVWVLQMGLRDWLWELATGWAEEITCFQLVQDARHELE